MQRIDAHAISNREGSERDGIHLLWSGPSDWGYSPTGFDILRRPAMEYGLDRCEILEGSALQRLQERNSLTFPLGEARFRTAGPFQSPFSTPGSAPATELSGDVAIMQRTLDRPGPSPERLPGELLAVVTPYSEVYTLIFDIPQPHVRLRVASERIVAVAFRNGKAILGKEATSPALDCRVEFIAPHIDRIVLYSASVKRLEVCVLTDHDRQRLGDWSGAKVLVRGLQMPVADCNPTLGSPAEELEEARSRLLRGEAISDSDFADFAGVMRGLALRAGGRPGDIILRDRRKTKDAFHDYRLLDLALLATIEPAGRRMMGLGYLDQDDLIADAAYDYRITGRWPEADLTDTVLGFENVPTGTNLPCSFHMAATRLDLPEPTPVEAAPVQVESDLKVLARRGIRLASRDGPCLSISFANAVREVTLELAPTEAHTLSYEAITGTFLQIPIATEVGAVPAGTRVRLTFAADMERLKLHGTGFLCAIRLHGQGGAGSAEQLVPLHGDVLGVRYVPTSPPAPPTSLTARNLQKRPGSGAPRDLVKSPPQSLGFALNWEMPIAGGTQVWPADIDAPPPMDAAGFVVQRRRADIHKAWTPIPVSRVFGNRRDAPEARALPPGADILAHFARPAEGIRRDFYHEDVLCPPEDKTREEPGSDWQYRIASVDGIGRHSQTWVQSPSVRLEKHIPPPQPAPPVGAPVTGVLAPAGVQAYLYERDDPDAHPDDVERFGTQYANVTVLRWSWTEDERKQDPWAKEFRVYFNPFAADRLAGRFLEPIVDEGGDTWRLKADFERSVARNALAGLRIFDGAQYFLVKSHDPGTKGVTIRLAHLRGKPAAPPRAGPFDLELDLEGDEARPAAFAKRIAWVPISPGRRDYEIVLPDLVTPTAKNPRPVFWVGVSAADDQWYVPDVVPATQPNGGRTGNESPVMTRPLTAHYRQRPVLTVPPPLAAVPEWVTDEPVGDAVPLRLDPGPYLGPVGGGAAFSASDQVQPERLALTELTRRLSAKETGGFRVRLPDGTEASYVPANPQDAAHLAEALASGEPTRVKPRFLRDLLRKHEALGALFAAVGSPREYGFIDDKLPSAAERYFYRLRLADAAGHLSEAAALLDVAVRVPSLMSPGAPVLAVAAPKDDRLRAEVLLTRTSALGAALLFFEDAPTDSIPGSPVPRAEVLRVPNRRDLYPTAGIGLIAASGEVLRPASVSVSALTEEPDGRAKATFDIKVGYGRRLLVYAVAASVDGIPSVPVGPEVAETALPPLAVPRMRAAHADGGVRVQWSAEAKATPVEVRIEKQVESTWTPITRWFAPSVTTALVQPGEGVSGLRLKVRSADGREAVGEKVQPP